MTAGGGPGGRRALLFVLEGAWEELEAALAESGIVLPPLPEAETETDPSRLELRRVDAQTALLLARVLTHGAGHAAQTRPARPVPGPSPGGEGPQ